LVDPSARRRSDLLPITGQPAAAVGRVLVLGGTGFIGSQVVQAFVGLGSAVRTVARRPPSGSWAQGLAGVEVVLGPVENPAILGRALEDVDWVVDAVGCPPPAASTDDFDATAASVRGLVAVLEALRARPGVGLTFFSSGGAVYGNVPHLPASEESRCRPISAYGLSKLMAESSIAAYSARYDVPARVLRVSNAYGPRQNAANGQGVVAAFLHAAAYGDPVALFDGGRALRDFVHVADVARAVVTLRPSLGEPQIVNVGGGTGYAVWQVLEIVERLTGVQLTIDRLPPRPTDVDSIVLDLSRLAALMPWRPRDLETGIAQTWLEYLAHAPGAPAKLPA
jgi:UDP-glucose 4-epimerase